MYIKKSLPFLLLMMCCNVVFGQVTPPFTILFGNSDTANRKLYVEVMYEKPSCQDYQAKFVLRTKTKDYGVLKIDTILNNRGTYEKIGDTVLVRPQAGGYKILFDLPMENGKVLRPSDSVSIGVITQAVPYLCKDCAATYSDVLFTNNDIDPDCPYSGTDMLACSRRSVYENWEGWIQDPRDCKPYRIVMMPDGRWWFAQNLNYQTDLTFRTRSQGSVATAGVVGEYWCPTGVSAENGRSMPIANSTFDGFTHSPTSCNTYGALYSWTTAMAYNGRTTLSSGASAPTALGASSNSQGICPEGWYMPSDYDWGLLLNSVEEEFDSMFTTSHIYLDASISEVGSRKATASLKNTTSCRPHASPVDSVCATYTNPAWSWFREDYTGKMSTANTLGEDKYGFSVLPAGLRYYTGAYYESVGSVNRFHSSSQYSSTQSYYRHIKYSGVIGRAYDYKGTAISVRCYREDPAGSVAIPQVRISAIGVNGGTSTATVENVPSGYTVNWYDTPTGGAPIATNASSYSTTTPTRVYAELSSGNTVSSRRVAADLYQRYDNTAIISVNSMTPGKYSIILAGAKGGNGGSTTYAGGIGGNGGVVKAVMNIASTSNIQIVTGKIGANATCGVSGNQYGAAGGWGAGGGGGSGMYHTSATTCGGGGGGGLSLIRFSDGTLIAIAGGGGGGGGGSSQPSSTWNYGPGTNGGAGGGFIAEDGGSKYSGSVRYFAGGGTQSQDSNNGYGVNSWGRAIYGAGAYYGGGNGNASSFAAGARGAYTSNSSYQGGGGGAGAGYQGGSGGHYGNGGGGGSSYTNPSFTINVEHVQGGNSSNGYVYIYKR